MPHGHTARSLASDLIANTVSKPLREKAFYAIDGQGRRLTADPALTTPLLGIARMDGRMMPSRTEKGKPRRVRGPDGQVYDTIKDAALATGIPYPSFYKCLRAGRAPGWLVEAPELGRKLVLDTATGTVRVPLTRGMFAVVDEVDADLVSRFKWHVVVAEGLPYAATRLGGAAGERKAKMHRVILGAPGGLLIDHRNGDTLDNRRDNLRSASSSLNTANSKLTIRPKSGHCGVYQKKDKYHAVITVLGRQIFLGSFLTLDDAAAAYRAARRQHFGEFDGALRPDNPEPFS